MWILTWILIVAALPVGLIGNKLIPSYAGPYSVVLRKISNESIYAVNSTGKIWLKHYYSHPKPRDPLQYFWGESYVGIPIDNNVNMVLRVSKWSNNQWKRNAFVFTFEEVCSAAIKFAPFLIRLLTGEEDGKCPISEGHRVINNQSISINFWAVPIFPYGRWLATSLIYRKGILHTQTHFELDTVPKL